VTTTLRCAVLDDYQGVALSMADWSPVADRVEVTAFTEHRADSEELVAALTDVDIVVVMRERTPLPAPVFARLPRLRLVVTTGMRNSAIDLPAAAAHGVLVCGTASSPVPPTELTWEPLPADDVLRTLPTVLATPHLGYVAVDNYRTYFREAVEDIAAFLAGTPIRTLS